MSLRFSNFNNNICGNVVKYCLLTLYVAGSSSQAVLVIRDHNCLRLPRAHCSCQPVCVMSRQRRGRIIFQKKNLIPMISNLYLLYTRTMVAKCIPIFSILLTHEGSHREVYQEFQPSYDIFHRWCQGLFRPQVPCTPSLHCPMANSALTPNQQPV